MIWWILGAWLYGAATFLFGCLWATQRHDRMVDLMLTKERKGWIILHNPDGPIDTKWYDA